MGSAKNLIPKSFTMKKQTHKPNAGKSPPGFCFTRLRLGLKCQTVVQLWRERSGDGERERAGDGERETRRWRERDPAMERERPGDGERERDPVMERETRPWREKEVSWSAMGFGGRGWAEDFGREILKILEKKSEKSGGKFGPCVLEAELIFFFFKEMPRGHESQTIVG